MAGVVICIIRLPLPYLCLKRNLASLEAKVVEVTNDENLDDHIIAMSGKLMDEIAEATFSKSQRDFDEIMKMVFYRMVHENKSNWKRTRKSLDLLGWLVVRGSWSVVIFARDHLDELRSLQSYFYVDERGNDRGIKIRHAAKNLVDLIEDDDRIMKIRSEQGTDERWFSVNEDSFSIPVPATPVSGLRTYGQPLSTAQLASSHGNLSSTPSSNSGPDKQTDKASGLFSKFKSKFGGEKVPQAILPDDKKQKVCEDVEVVEVKEEVEGITMVEVQTEDIIQSRGQSRESREPGPRGGDDGWFFRLVREIAPTNCNFCSFCDNLSTFQTIVILVAVLVFLFVVILVWFVHPLNQF